MSMMFRNATWCKRLELIVFWSGVNDQGRQKLLKCVIILAEHEPEELLSIVRDQIDLQSIVDAFFIYRCIARFEADYCLQR